MIASAFEASTPGLLAALPWCAATRQNTKRLRPWNRSCRNACKPLMLVYLPPTLDACRKDVLGVVASAGVVFGAGRLVPTYDNTFYTALLKPKCVGGCDARR